MSRASQNTVSASEIKNTCLCTILHPNHKTYEHWAQSAIEIYEINTRFSLDNHSAAKLAKVQPEQQGRMGELGHRCVYMIWKNEALKMQTKKDVEAEEEEKER